MIAYTIMFVVNLLLATLEAEEDAIRNRLLNDLEAELCSED